MSDIVNTLGLVANIAGVVVVFLYAFPQPTFDGGTGIGLEDGTRMSDGRTAGEHREDAKRLQAKYRDLSKAGLVLLGLGFALQLWATWM